MERSDDKFAALVIQKLAGSRYTPDEYRRLLTLKKKLLFQEFNRGDLDSEAKRLTQEFDSVTWFSEALLLALMLEDIANLWSLKDTFIVKLIPAILKLDPEKELDSIKKVDQYGIMPTTRYALDASRAVWILIDAVQSKSLEVNSAFLTDSQEQSLFHDILSSLVFGTVREAMIANLEMSDFEIRVLKLSIYKTYSYLYPQQRWNSSGQFWNELENRIIDISKNEINKLVEIRLQSSNENFNKFAEFCGRQFLDWKRDYISTYLERLASVRKVQANKRIAD
jgi:hypothetical protein